VLSFDGNEVYMKAWPELAGKSFFDTSFAFEGAVPIGVKRPRGPGEAPEIILNPKPLLV
jgi:hypothetical protein